MVIHSPWHMVMCLAGSGGVYTYASKVLHEGQSTGGVSQFLLRRSIRLLELWLKAIASTLMWMSGIRTSNLYWSSVYS